MGPSKGIKFRGGAAPAPPKWYFNPEDVRAYDRYERKVLLWEMQARHFMSQAEIGLTLYASLQGEAEQQLEFLEMSEVYSKTGVKTILGLLERFPTKASLREAPLSPHLRKHQPLRLRVLTDFHQPVQTYRTGSESRRRGHCSVLRC